MVSRETWRTDCDCSSRRSRSWHQNSKSSGGAAGLSWLLKLSSAPPSSALSRAGRRGEGAPSSGDFGIAAADGDGGQVAIAIDEKAVFAGTQQGDGGVGSIHLKALAFAERAQADMEGAAGK